MDYVIQLFSVLVVVVIIAGSISCLYALGLRLWAGGLWAESSDDAKSGIPYKLGTCLCFGGCICIVLYALYLMIPIFH